MATSCIIATHWSKIAKFLYPTCIYHPCKRWPRENFVKMFDAGKTRMIGLPYGERNCDNMLSRFHTIPELNGRTDRQTDLLYQYRASVYWRAIKTESCTTFKLRGKVIQVRSNWLSNFEVTRSRSRSLGSKCLNRYWRISSHISSNTV